MQYKFLLCNILVVCIYIIFWKMNKKVLNEKKKVFENKEFGHVTEVSTNNSRKRPKEVF